MFQFISNQSIQITTTMVKHFTPNQIVELRKLDSIKDRQLRCEIETSDTTDSAVVKHNLDSVILQQSLIYNSIHGYLLQ